MNKRKINVIVCRLQTPYLTQGHQYIADLAQDNSDKLVIVLGVATTNFTTTNPLNYEMRKDMVQTMYPLADIYPLKDVNDDLIWSNELDVILEPYIDDDVCIYGGRDSCLPYYVGKFNTLDIGETPFDSVNATSLRERLKDYSLFHEIAKDLLPPFLLKGVDKEVLEFAFRCGVIHASQNKFPIAYATVDIGVIKLIDGKVEILLGQKFKQNIWVIVGGFVDVTDENYKFAANRELGEEVKGIKTTELKFIDSVKIDDWRYRKTPDKIFTNLFITSYISGEPEGADDLEFAQFFPIEQAYNLIGDHHKPLLKLIENNLELVGMK